MVFCFVQKFFFGQHESLEYYFFFQNTTLSYMTKTLNQIYFFSFTKIPKIRICFSATLGYRIFFQKKNHNPPFKLNGNSLRLFKSEFSSFILIINNTITGCIVSKQFYAIGNDIKLTTISLINNKNKRGPSMESCGTPALMEFQVEQYPFMQTRCLRSER